MVSATNRLFVGRCFGRTFLLLCFVLTTFGVNVSAQDTINPATIKPAKTDTSSATLLKDERLKDERLHATIWVQGSLEYAMATTQVYQTATDNLPKYARDSTSFACLEQGQGDNGNLPPAVILDVDETVLNNVPYQARLVTKSTEFQSETWSEWVLEAKATVIPGARAFIHFARSQGIEVFFVTNRSAELKAATVENLSRELGYQVANDRVLLKNEKPEWTSDKTSRRQHVTSTHRVIMLFGDDFNDFFFLGNLTPQQRRVSGSELSQRFGRQWMLLPNPQYGNWEQAIYQYDYSKSPAEKLKLKHEALDTMVGN